jgi:hypothetical protein
MFSGETVFPGVAAAIRVLGASVIIVAAIDIPARLLQTRPIAALHWIGHAPY